MLLLSLAACKKDAPSSTTPTPVQPKPVAMSEKTFTLMFTAETKREDGVTVTVLLPDDAKIEVDATGTPNFGLAGLVSFFPPSLVALRCSERKDAAGCVEWAIRLQYDESELARLERVTLPDGRVWMKHVRADGFIHARLFVPAPAHHGVLMCVAMLKAEDAARVDEIRAICETVRLK